MNSQRSHLARLSRDWSKLGAEDPLWAVCVDPDRRGGRWDPEEFLASGRAEVNDSLDRINQLGISLRRGDALDFGCGVGRLTTALSTHFEAVTGVDISRPMLDRALTMHAGNSRCTFMHNDGPDLSPFGDASFDLVYSSLVLQHMPRALAAGYLLEFIRVLRPGGAIVVVVPEAHRRTARGNVYAYAPQSVIGLIQRKLYGYPATMQMRTLPARWIRRHVEPQGGRLVNSYPRQGAGDHWRMACHFITKDAPEPAV
jgi:ubiquinone/menaquinone biosynthesis C-methylase UbiE